MCMATNIAPCLPRVRGRGEGGRGSFDELCRLILPRRDSGRTLLRIVSSSLQSSRENERISVGKNVFSFFRKFSRPTRIERSRVSTLTRKQSVRENILLHFSRLHEGVCKWNTVCVYKCTGWCNVTGGQFEICTYVDTISLLAKLFPTDDDFDEKKSIQYPVQFSYWLIWWIDCIGNV